MVNEAAIKLHAEMTAPGSFYEKNGSRFKNQDTMTKDQELAYVAGLVDSACMIGEHTMEQVFIPAGLTDLSDLQAVFDAVEKALTPTQLTAAGIPASGTALKALQWYEDQVRALAVYSLQENGEAMLACVTALTLDAGKRATEAMERHPDDKAVDEFAAAMKAKLAKKRGDGYSGWWDPNELSWETLRRQMLEHVGKLDPVDVGNYAMFFFNRQEKI